MSEREVRNFIAGRWVAGTSGERMDIENPATGASVAWFAASTESDVDAAVQAGIAAFADWRDTAVTKRAAILFAFRQLLNEHVDELSRTIVEENGKTLGEARGETVRALEYVEHACAIPELMKGSFSENVGGGVDTQFVREPLGVFSIIAPFNFPAMIPLYFVWALGAGDSVVVKPSELCPLTTIRIMELADQAGLPPGTVNMVLGGPEVVRRLATHPDVEGISFVGSSSVARAVYELASAHGKRAQCQGGAKNHLVVTDSAQLDRCLENIVNSVFGNSSQRCFAGSNVLVYESIYEEFRESFLEEVRAIRIGNGLDKDVTMGPVISAPALQRFHSIIDEAVSDGAKLLLDGRNGGPPGSGGHFLGPTVLEAAPGMQVFDEEVFGPIRCMMPVKGLTEAINIVNRSRFGHTAVIYTEEGGVARRFAHIVNTGQVGINVGTPAPIAFYPVGGRRVSFYGSLRGRANDAIDFYTDKKVIVTTWYNQSG